MVYTKSPILKNSACWPHLRARYRHAVAGEILVRRPGRGKVFEAAVGVDSNDLGYYSNQGRGSVIASVEAGGHERFHSGVMRESVAGTPVQADLAGATEFRLKLTAVGERPPTYHASWDQADWADARVTLADDRIIWLADLPVDPLPAGSSTEPRFRSATTGCVVVPWPL